MNKTTKSALAAGAAAVLLMGGAGSLAYWTDAETVTGGTVASGHMSLDGTTCDAGWKYAEGTTGAGSTVNKFVPGDVVSKSCTFTVSAVGDHLEGTLTTPATATITSPTGTSLAGTVTATYAKAASGSTTFTPIASGAILKAADNGYTIKATIRVDFPYGSDENATPKVNTNDTQDKTVTLSDIAVTLKQNNPN